MSETEIEEVVERLEAEVKASGKDPDDLGIVDKSEYKETREKIGSLEEENDGLREEIDEVKKLYAESLAEATGLDEDFFMDKEVSDLRELHEEKVDESPVDTPAPSSGDVTEEEEQAAEEEKDEKKKLEEFSEKFSNTDLVKYPRIVNIESKEDLKEIIETYERRAKQDSLWESAAEPYREALEELTA